MRVRVSRCGSLFAHSDKLVWDDYLAKRQRALVAGVEKLLRHFVGWAAIETAGSIGEPKTWWISAAHELVVAEILIVENSARDDYEKELVAAWGSWGHSSIAYHFASRSTRSTVFSAPEGDNERLTRKAIEEPPPPAHRRDIPARATHSLPHVSDAEWHVNKLPEVFLRRRSTRCFSGRPISLSKLGPVLQVAAGESSSSESRKTDPTVQAVFKASPSGGARHPTELYVYARNVAELDAGLYHYRGDSHTLEELGRSVDEHTLIDACGDQRWVVRGSAAFIFYSSVLARTRWKYPEGRAYRVTLMDLGHLSQNVYLAATALGLVVTFSAAIRDETVENLLRLRSPHEAALGVSVLGDLPAAPEG